MKSSELLRKYNVPGPRYTSYPTVPYWAVNPTEDQWVQSIRSALVDGKKTGVGAAVYMHIPFCERLCTYCGCNTRITRNKGVSDPYIKTLLQEWELYRKKLDHGVVLSELHLGGGTPTFLEPKALHFLLSSFFKTVKRSDDFEFSIEADPRVTRKEHLEVLAELGFRRLSLGVQDFDPKVQEIVHRVQSPEQVWEVTRQARELGFTSVNYDLIYGLPLQTQKSVRDTIEVVCQHRPDRIAFYSYAHVPWIKPGQRRFTEADLPSGDAKRSLYEMGREMLEEAGYDEIGMDHFALPSDSLWKSNSQKVLHRNFMGYISRQVAPLIGLGVSAIGDSWNIFAQNEKLLENYVKRVEAGEIPIFRGHVLSEEDLVVRRHILNLMTQMETQWSSKEEREFFQQVPEALGEMISDGLVELNSNNCRVTEEGRPFLRNVCMAFDAHLFRKNPGTQLFSQTI